MPIPIDVALDRLAAVLERENSALSAMDMRRAAALLPEKTAAMADLTALAARAPGTTNPVVSAAASRLDGLARENRHLLERAIAAQQRVIGIIVGAATSVAVEPGYGAAGRRAGVRVPMALSTRA